MPLYQRTPIMSRESRAAGDRIVFRGYLRMLCFADGTAGFLDRVGVLPKDFGEHVQAISQRLIEASTAAAQKADRPTEYLALPKIRKDEFARNIALEHDIQDGYQVGRRMVRRQDTAFASMPLFLRMTWDHPLTQNALSIKA